MQTILFDAACNGFGAAVVNSISLHEVRRIQKSLPPKCHSFILQDAPVYTVSLAYRKDFSQPKYIDDFVRCIQNEFQNYNDQIIQTNM